MLHRAVGSQPGRGKGRDKRGAVTRDHCRTGLRESTGEIARIPRGRCDDLPKAAIGIDRIGAREHLPASGVDDRRDQLPFPAGHSGAECECLEARRPVHRNAKRLTQTQCGGDADANARKAPGPNPNDDLLEVCGYHAACAQKVMRRLEHATAAPRHTAQPQLGDDAVVSNQRERRGGRCGIKREGCQRAPRAIDQFPNRDPSCEEAVNPRRHAQYQLRPWAPADPPRWSRATQ